MSVGSVAAAITRRAGFIDGKGSQTVKSAQATSNENNVNIWTLLFAALALASASGLAVVARRAGTLQRRVAELSAELDGVNEQLEMFTVAISDELKAPLRELHRAGRHVLQLERVEMTALAQEVVDELLPRYPQSRVTVVEMPAIKGDRTLAQLAEQHFLGQRLLDMFLDDARQGPCAM